MLHQVLNAIILLGFDSISSETLENWCWAQFAHQERNSSFLSDDGSSAYFVSSHHRQSDWGSSKARGKAELYSSIYSQLLSH